MGTSAVGTSAAGGTALEAGDSCAVAAPGSAGAAGGGTFFLVDARASYDVASWARVTLQVNNLLDADRVYPSGYSYRVFSGEVNTGTAYYYPQAGRNAVVLMDFDF